jgi:hypothetical protein
LYFHDAQPMLKALCFQAVIVAMKGQYLKSFCCFKSLFICVYYSKKRSLF